MKRNKLYLFVALGLVILLTAIFFIVKGTQKEKPLLPKKQSPLTTRILINELPLADRPFTVLVPQATNRLFTFVTIGADKASSASLDLEYQSGDLLKGSCAARFISGNCIKSGSCTVITPL